MSSIESMISEIETEYHRILGIFQNYLTKEEYYYRFQKISEKELSKLLRDVMGFQRKIEYFTETAVQLVKKNISTERLENIAGRLINQLSTDKTIESTQFLVYQNNPQSYRHDVIGVIPELKNAHNSLLHDDERKTRRSCYCSYFGFKSMRINLIELEEELRLIGALTTYPIAKKITLKHQLILNDFEEVAISLEEAESNAETEHFKDCVSRCRDSMEIFVALVREKETGEKTERRFVTDLGKIVKIEVFDVGTQRLAQGIYSFLSLKGSHKYDAKKVTVYDAETALKETYSLLEMLLKRYLDLKKTKTAK